MPANEQNSIYILSRNNYDSFQDKGNNIFFVRENSPECGMSLYVGDASQSDLTVVDGSSTWTDGNNVEHTIWDKNTNLYDIPSSLQVQNKLFLIKKEINDETIYSSVIWNGDQFSDCGIPNNVIVLTDVEEGISDLSQWLSQNITGIKDFIYIIPNYHSIYYYDGANGYISIISTDSFVTVEMLNEVAARIPIADELTILSRTNNNQTEFYGVGADLSSKVLAIPVPDASPIEYNITYAQSGAHIFNDYSYTEIPMQGTTFKYFSNTVAGQKSNAFGQSNTIYREATFCNAFGVGNSIGNTTQGSTLISSSTAIGESNIIRCSNSMTIGYGNKLNISAKHSISIGGYNKNNTATSNTIVTPRSVVIGNGNTMDAIQDSENNFIIGKSNSIGNATSGDTKDTYIFGWDNHAGANYGLTFSGRCVLIGNGLQNETTPDQMIIGKYNFDGTRYSSGLPAGDFRIGDGTEISRHDAVSISNSTIYINTTRSVNNTGEIVSGTGSKLSMVSGNGGTESGDTLYLGCLPTNNCIYSLDPSNSIDKIAILTGSSGTLTNKFYFYPTTLGQNGCEILLESVKDYSCLLVIPKLASFTTASDILVNFTANDASRVYLLNPDIDITDYTVLHVLLFYDLTNLCAIVSGYEEVTTP